MRSPATVFRHAALAIALLAAGFPLGAQSDALAITAAPAALSFSFQTGGALPAEQKVQVKRGGSGPAVDFTAAAPAAAPWLIVSPSTGKTGTAFGVRVNPGSLLAGTYTAVIEVTAAGAANPAPVSVTLSVRNPPPAPTALPAGLAFTFQTDQAAPAAQAITVSSSGEPISFTAAASGGAWLKVEPALGIAVTGSPASVSVTADTAGLVPGAYTGKITLAFPNASVKSLAVPVSLTVAAGVPVVDSVWPNAAPVGSNDAVITIRGRHFFQSSTVQAGATQLAATWVGATVMLAVVPKALLAETGALAITVTNTPQPASTAVNFTVTPPGPLIATVVNAASFATGSPAPTISPGEIISIFGSGLGPAALLQAAPANGVFPTSLGTPPTVVEFELAAGQWTPAPIIFAQANQVNAVAPFGMAPAAGVKLRVTYNNLASQPFSFDAVESHPGLFTTDSSGRGQAAALNYNETTRAYSLNAAGNPAPKGSIVVFYATGGGALDPAPQAEGEIVPSSAPAPRLAGQVSVTIGGDGATVQSATAVPGSLAGLVQLNVTVPSSVKAAKDLPVVVTVAGRASPATATLSVK